MGLGLKPLCSINNENMLVHRHCLIIKTHKIELYSLFESEFASSETYSGKMSLSSVEKKKVVLLWDASLQLKPALRNVN